jgi:uracil permease
MVIGLVLAPVAVHMAMGRTGDGAAWLVPQSTP